jgi:hypothetical protein
LAPRGEEDGHVVAVVFALLAVGKDLQLEVEFLGLPAVGFDLK